MQRLDISNNGNSKFETQRQASEMGMDGNGIVFDFQNSMGTHSITLSRGHQQSEHNFSSFFMRLGHYNVNNILSTHKKMAALAIKISVILANLMGLSLWIWWLTIDFDGIKIFLSSVGVFLWGAMKLYEKYLDIKKKRRDDKNSGTHTNHHLNGKK